MILDDATGDLVDLPCRSIRVGSYKSMPKERAKFTEKGIHLKVPDICSGMKDFLQGYLWSIRLRKWAQKVMPSRLAHC